MGRAFVYVILGGGVAAGYAAHEFVKRGVSPGELCIISEEPVAPYERPALSKGYLHPEAPSRLPSFHCCAGTNEEILNPEQYMKYGIQLILRTRVKSADVKRKTLVTSTGVTINYKYLIVATGSRALRLEEIGVNASTASNICYLRNIADADTLASVMKSNAGGNAVIIGGGYIGMECAASLVLNKLNVTIVFPGTHCMSRLFTPKIAKFYEEFYQSKGVKFVKETAVTSFDFSSEGKKVTDVNLGNGSKLRADVVVVGIGSRANTGLFEGQLTMDKGGIKVNGKMQSSNTSVYAVGDVAAFPVKILGETKRLEHVDSARKTARHAVAAIMEPETTPDFDYLPFFYSRVFTLSWQFYGDNAGETVHFGDFSSRSFGAYWIKAGRVVGSFLEGGTNQEHEALSEATRLQPVVEDLTEVERRGLEFAVLMMAKPTPVAAGGAVVLKKPLFVWYAIAAGVLVAALAYWCRRREGDW